MIATAIPSLFQRLQWRVFCGKGCCGGCWL